MKFYRYILGTILGVSMNVVNGDTDIYKDFLNSNFSETQSESSSGLLGNIEYRQRPDLPMTSQELKLNVTGLDQKIDEDSYMLGSGDGLTIYVWGSVNKLYKSVIDHEGNFVLPSLGSVNVRGMTLREGKEKIREKVYVLHKKVDVTIVLSQIRKFKVHILGEVKEPGGYIVNGATRVSDLVTLAKGMIQNTIIEHPLNAYDIRIQNMPKLRAIEIRNDEHPKRFADLALFYNYNNIDKNYYLNEGDRVFISKSKNVVGVYGAVNYPGEYNYMPHDTLITLLKASGGLTFDADSTRIIVTRFADDIDSLTTIELSFSDSSVYYFPIEKDDRILVCGIPDYRKHRKVVIRGEINYPGVYPIKKDRTKFSEVIEMAGGLTEDAYLRGSKIVRKIYNKVGDREFQRLIKTPAENLSPLEQSYLKTKMVEEEGIISIDLEELIEKGNDFYDVILRDSDTITIARNNLSINVMGAVISPGLVNFKEGADHRYYIDQAGGFKSKARKASISIIKGGTDVMLRPNKVKNLEAGDAIWVPEKMYVNTFNVIRDILLVSGSVFTLIISVFTIRELTQDE